MDTVVVESRQSQERLARRQNATNEREASLKHIATRRSKKSLEAEKKKKKDEQEKLGRSMKDWLGNKNVKEAVEIIGGNTPKRSVKERIRRIERQEEPKDKVHEVGKVKKIKEIFEGTRETDKDDSRKQKEIEWNKVVGGTRNIHLCGGMIERKRVSTNRKTF